MFDHIRRSVRFKVVAVILAATLAALLVSTVALLTYDVRNYRDFLVTDATTQAEIVARTSAPALQFDDPGAAAANLALLESRRGITAAAIYDPKGRLFATFVRNGEPPVPSVLESPHGSLFTGGNLELYHPIIENEQIIGTVYLRAAYDLMDRLEDYLLILGAVMFLSLIVAAVISLRLQRSVTAPVLAVTALARKVIDERDFTLRAERTSDDEIGVLVDSFNTMLAEVGQRTAALEETNRRLREESEERKTAEAALLLADRRKDEFLATLAHELRNPLAPMVNALSLMGNPGHAAATPRAMQIIRRQLAHMVRLVDDLLDVSRITRGKLAVQAQDVDLATIVQSAVDTVQPLVQERGHTLTVRLPEQPVPLRADPVRLSQVFSNLLSNAAKYTDPGGRIEVGAEVVGDRVRVTVSDDGIGISRETLPTIFEMFTQGDSSVERTQSGLGVGLALTRRLIELHGGRIEAHSEGLGSGSTFVVELGIQAKRQAAAEARTDDMPEDPGEATHRILLVDDNVDFATSLCMLLETLGNEVRVAHDAESAVEVARELRPDVAFLDIGLPVVSGYDLARRLHKLPETENTLLIALSGWGQEQDRQRSREAGFSQHLVKPVELDEIEKILKTLIRGDRL
ncbi:MAG: response regulator [Gammaproteobacteria bacterium]|nr:response regulator [Gammaproteobacteria bacterium]